MKLRALSPTATLNTLLIVYVLSAVMLPVMKSYQVIFRDPKWYAADTAIIGVSLVGLVSWIVLFFQKYPGRATLSGVLILILFLVIFLPLLVTIWAAEM